MNSALVFDLDGTIADTETLHYAAWEKTLVNNGVKEFSFEQFLHYVGTSNEKVAGDYGNGVRIEADAKALILEKQQTYMELIPQVELFGGVVDFIHNQHGRMKLAVASSSHEKEVRAILAGHQLEPLFETIFCGDMVQKRKPDPEIYLKTADALGIAPEKCVAFEDSCHGITAAKRSGMKCVAIPNRFTQNHDMSQADVVMESFFHITEDVVKQLLG